MPDLSPHFSGTLFGIITLVVGIGMGVALREIAQRLSNRTTEPSDEYKEHLSGMLKLTNHFSGDLNKQVELLRILEKKLANQSEDGNLNSLSDTTTLELLTEVMSSNQSLRRELTQTEADLKTKARELAETASQARTDALTELFNRRAFDEELSKRWATWKRRHVPFSLLIIDIDHFKSVNDQHGHDAGDLVLQEISRRLKTSLRDTDYIARIGGEEIAMIVPESDEGASIASQRVLEAIREEPVRYDDVQIPLTASCGVMSVMSGDSAEELLKGADIALYTAKTSGRNRAYLYDGHESVLIECQPGDQPEPTAVPTYTEQPETNPLEDAAERLKRRLGSLDQ